MTTTTCDMCNKQVECTEEEANLAAMLTLAKLYSGSGKPIVFCDNCEPIDD